MNRINQMQRLIQALEGLTHKAFNPEDESAVVLFFAPA